MRGFSADLALFVTVAETGSFSAAGRKLGVAASSVARRIDAMEAELGTRLINRSTRRLGLTESGGILFERGRSILASIDDARAAVTDADDRLTGRLRISASIGFGQRQVAPALGAFTRRYPGVTVELRLEDDFVDLIEADVDVAIRIGRLPDSRLKQVRLAPLRRIAVASPDYLARRGAPAHPDDLPDHDCLLVAGSVGQEGGWRFAVGTPATPAAHISTNTPEAAAAAARSGAGIAHLPCWLVADDIAAGRLVPLLESFEQPPDPRAGVHLVWLPGPSARVRAFIDFFRDHVGRPASWDAALAASP